MATVTEDIQHQSSGSSVERNREPAMGGYGSNPDECIKLQAPVQLAPGEIKSFMSEAGCASVYLKGTEHGMPVMFLKAEDVEITEEALQSSLRAMSAVLQEKVDFAICYDLRNMRRPSMSDTRAAISWMNEEENSDLLAKHAMITCVMVGDTWAGMAISGGVKLIKKLCSPAKPTFVVYTEEERDDFLKEAILKHLSKCDSRSTAED
ncbi:unnamed protein product [Cladocopium goreaui]|uniref:SET domain-containing protein 4 n=1 Tax=Cladocopium goreaui TaxID=2562237 RepID=A0A9P1DUJ7_9DINO|nr:unnamed protein product [Cladocopium goreaui]